MRSSNVRPFRRPQPNSPIPERLLGAVFYVALGSFLAYNPGFQGSFVFFGLIAAAYFFLIKKGVVTLSYFLRYHYLQSFILFLFVSMGLLLLTQAVLFIQAGSLLVGLGGAMASFLSGVFWGLAMAKQYGLLLVGLSQGVVALMGRTHRIPHVTPHVIYWV